MLAAQAVGQVLARLGADHVFGLVGSGNFHVTNALAAAGARFIPAAHEGGAATMADAFARVSGKVAVLTVHQGPGVTNALTGITEAAKSRTPLIVLAPEATAARSNFSIDLAGLASATGAFFHRVRSESVADDVVTAWNMATQSPGGTVILALPLDVQALDVASPTASALRREPAMPVSPVDVSALVTALSSAQRPVFIAGRGAVRQPVGAARSALVRLADRCGALLATSAAAKGLFAGEPWNLDVSGGFASPLAASLIGGADLIVAWGCTLNMWTTRHGRLLSPKATVIQVDVDESAVGANRPVDVGVVGDIRLVADAVYAALDGHEPSGWRTPALQAAIASGIRWRDVSYMDESGPGTIDPRTFSIALDDLLPADRVIAVDSGNFMGYPSMFLSIPDSAGFCFTQAYQSVGLGLASAIGAALAQPGRLPVAALGDGGFLMSVAELTTVVRLGLPMVIAVYNDAAFGAEVHHFGPDGYPLDTVTYPDPDIAAIGRGFGCSAVTVRSASDLAGVRSWLSGPRDTPLVIDAKIHSSQGSWWLEEAFHGH